MYKLDHAPELLEFQAVQRRQRLDHERMQRIFDPKIRVIGIDKSGLEEQIRAKHEMRQIEEDRNNTHDKVATETNKLLQLLDTKADVIRHEFNSQVNKFRQDHQKTEERRDFDLYDPQALKKGLPARLGDDDVRNTVSGMQKFEGEDLEKSKRTRMQHHQMELWTWQRMRENEAKMKEEAAYDLKREHEVIQNNSKILHLVELERQFKKTAAKSDMEFNQKLALEKKLREEMEAKAEAQKNLDETTLMREGDFLTERYAQIPTGPHSFRVDSHKSMTAEKIAEIHAVRAKQVEESRTRLEREKNVEKAWASQNFWASRATLLMERERLRLEKERQLYQLEENRKIAAESKTRKNFIDQVVYTNPPTEAFFSQFNTTSR